MEKLKVRYLYFLLLSFLMICHVPLKGNNYYFNRLSKKQGLPGTNIRVIYQDHFGYMWFAIEAFGLCRYDGKNIVVYEYIPGDSCSISNNFIWDVASDVNNNLWIATENGLNFFDRQQQKFIAFYHHSENSISDNFVMKIFRDKKGNMWFGSSNGLNKIHVDDVHRMDQLVDKRERCKEVDFTPYFEHYLYKDSVSHANGIIKVININEDSHENIWVSTDKGVFMLDPDSNSIRHFKHIKNENSLVHDYVHFVKELERGTYLIGTDRGICYYHQHENRFEQISFHEIGHDDLDLKGYYNYLVDSKGTEWIGFSEGLFIGKGLSNNRRGMDFQYITEGEKGLGSKIIRDITEDSSGQVWIGTKFSGLHYYEGNQQLFPYHQIEPVVNSADHVDDNFVLSLLADNQDNIWVGTKYGGLFRLNRNSMEYESYWVDVDMENPVNSNRIECIYQDRSGKVWLGTPKGLKELISGDKHFKSRSSMQVRAMYEDSHGNFWLGTTRGIYVYDRNTGTPMHYAHNGNTSFFSDSTKFIYTIGEDNNQNIWFGTQENGLYAYNPHNDKVRHYKNDPSDMNSVSGNMIRDIYMDTEKRLWISTKHNGVNYYDATNDFFVHYSKKDGLPSNTVYAIAEDLNGDLWFGTHNGLSKFNTRMKAFTNYNESHGLQSNIFENDARTVTSDGYVLFGGQKGFNMFHPDSIEFKKYDPPLVINYVKANDRIVLREINRNTTFELPYDQNYLAFEFALLDYRNQSENEFRYKLEGVDKDWVDASGRNYILYPDLKHGTYTFMVQSMGTNISRRSDIIEVNLTINPPFWLTNIAYIIYGILILAFLWGIYKIATLRTNYQHHLKEAQRQLKRTMELNQTKLRFFTNISHEFQAPLALIMAPVEKLLTASGLSNKELQYVELIQKNSKRLNQLIQQLMYFRKTENEVTHLEVSKIDIVEFIREITAPYYSFAQDCNINFQFIHSKEQIMLWFDPDKMEKIMSNLLMNAFKFTPSGGMIEVSLGVSPNQDLDLLSQKRFSRKPQQGEYVKLTVRDTGRGMTKEHLDHIFDRFYSGLNRSSLMGTGTGVGLELTKTLVEMHGGIITTDSSEGKGSVFTIWLRFGNEHFDNKNISNREIQVKDFVTDIDVDFIFTDQENAEEEQNNNTEFISDNNNSHKNGHVLIVDDNSDLRKFLKENLAEHYTVHTARDGMAGLEVAKSQVPDLIISDVLMPHMDGIEMCKEIKSTVATSHIPVILLTRKAYIEDKIIGLQTGADDYIEKPFHTEYLLLRIRNIFENQQKVKEMLRKSLNQDDMHLTDISVYDQQLLDKCTKAVIENISNTEYSIEDLGKTVGLSRSQLYRKMTALTGQTPNEFLYMHRLREAKKLMLENGYSITDAAHMTGFKSVNSFSTVFKKKFGQSPKNFVSTKRV